MSLLILVVDNEPDVEALFRQRFKRDIRDGRFTMDFAQSADSALQLISDVAGGSLFLILFPTKIPGIGSLYPFPKSQTTPPDPPPFFITPTHAARNQPQNPESGAEDPTNN